MKLYRIEYKYRTYSSEVNASRLVLANNMDDAISAIKSKFIEGELTDPEIISVFREYSDEDEIIISK